MKGTVALALSLCLISVSSFANPTAGAARFRVVSHASLKPAPLAFSCAVADGQTLLVPDNMGGKILLFDLKSGKQVGIRGQIGKQRGQFEGPVRLFPTAQGFGVLDRRRAFLFFDATWGLTAELPTEPRQGETFFAGVQPLWLDGRLACLGYASPGISGGRNNVFLFTLTTTGTIRPLLWSTRQLDNYYAFDGLPSTDGGLAGLRDGDWIVLLPGTYELLRFNNKDQLIRRWIGDRTKYRPPDWASRPKGKDRAAFFAWAETLCRPKAPIDLGQDTIGVLLIEPISPGHLAAWMEIYDASGTLLDRTAIPVPIDQQSEVILARSTKGRLVLVIRDSWSDGSPATVWELQQDRPTR